MSDPIEPLPQATGADHAYEAFKIGANLVPFVGGSAAELVEAVFGSPLARRRDAWFECLADVIRVLYRRQVPLDSPEFVSAVMQASRIALGTHLDAKLDMLKAAIINSALPGHPSDLIAMRFLRFVDELDPEHFVVLAYLRDPAGHFDRHLIPRQNMTMGSPGIILGQAQLGVSDATLAIVLADLSQRGLADGGSLGVTMTSQGAWAPRTHPLGNQLLDFVTFIEPPDEAATDA